MGRIWVCGAPACSRRWPAGAAPWPITRILPHVGMEPVAQPDPFARHEAGERPGKGNFVVARRPTDHLRDPPPAVPTPTTLPVRVACAGLGTAASQVAPQAAGRGHKAGKARPAPAHQPHTKRNAQRQHTYPAAGATPWRYRHLGGHHQMPPRWRPAASGTDGWAGPRCEWCGWRQRLRGR